MSQTEGKSLGGGVTAVSFDNNNEISIPVGQITKITRQAQKKEDFKNNKMLVPGYKSPEEYKALAKLAGMNP